MLSIEWDKSAQEELKRDLDALADAAEAGFPETMQEIGEIFADSIDEQFLSGGKPKWVPLAQRTIAERKEWELMTGQKVVAQYDTPLRRSDATRLASIATVPGVKGSAFKTSARMVQVGPDEKVLDYVRDLNDGNVEKLIPPREFVYLSEEHEKKAIQAGQSALDKLADKFNQ